MPIRPVLRYPHGTLKEPAAPAPLAKQERAALTEDLLDTMRDAPATVGLAAPQIGHGIRAFALDVSSHPKAKKSHGLLVVFDPVIVEAHESETMREGCLSVPDLTANVRRARRIVLQCHDVDGDSRVFQMEGFEARAVQHEVDHLDGMLILDRVASPSDLFARRVYR